MLSKSIHCLFFLEHILFQISDSEPLLNYPFNYNICCGTSRPRIHCDDIHGTTYNYVHVQKCSSHRVTNYHSFTLHIHTIQYQAYFLEYALHDKIEMAKSYHFCNTLDLLLVYNSTVSTYQNIFKKYIDGDPIVVIII